jgi:four helix bundle protein
VKSESDELSLFFFFTLTLSLTLLSHSTPIFPFLITLTVNERFYLLLIQISMFDFEKLIVYQKAKVFNSETRNYLKTTKLDLTTVDQLRRASLSIVLNIAEGSGRFSKADRRNFFIISRSSVFEVVAIYDVLKDESLISNEDFSGLYMLAEELSKILLTMIKNLKQ